MPPEVRVLLLHTCCAIGLASAARTPSQVPGLKTAEHTGEVVLVAGASGQSGREIVRQLREQGYTVRAMARSAQRLADLGPGVQPVVGDVTDPRSLVRALSQVNVVICAIVGPINRADVARVIVACMTDRTCSRKTITAINDPALTPDAWRAQLAALPRD